jgi:hypothetical protein
VSDLQRIESRKLYIDSRMSLHVNSVGKIRSSQFKVLGLREGHRVYVESWRDTMLTW